MASGLVKKPYREKSNIFPTQLPVKCMKERQKSRQTRRKLDTLLCMDAFVYRILNVLAIVRSVRSR